MRSCARRASANGITESTTGRSLPALSSILAHTGESAASTMLRVSAAVRACEEGYLPPTLGLTRPAEGYEGPLLTEARHGPIGAVLVPSFAQGGCNGALIVEHA